MGSEHRKYRQLQLEANKCLLIECTQYLDCDVRSLMINCLHVPHALNLLALLTHCACGGTKRSSSRQCCGHVLLLLSFQKIYTLLGFTFNSSAQKPCERNGSYTLQGHICLTFFKYTQT